MNEVLKQRLVGALILIALGVVFWPIIFVQPGEMTAALDGRIPTRPGVNSEQIAPPGKANLRESPKLTAALPSNPHVVPAAVPKPTEKTSESLSAKVPSADVSLQKSSKTRTEAPEKPTLDSDGVPIAWILQVASVSKADKAEDLRSQLLEMGYKAYVKKIRSGENVLLRVYIGPKFERAKLDKIKSGIDHKFGVQSLVVRYVP